MPSSTNPWFLAARPRTLPAAFAPVAVGAALAKHYFYPHGIAPVFGPNSQGYLEHGFAYLVIPTLLCGAFALLAQIGANFANDYFDGRRGADGAGRLGPARAVATGLISPRAMLVATFSALTLAAVTGLGLIYYGGWGMVIIGAASLFGALAYTPLAYHGLGEVFALVYFGFVAVIGTYYVETHDWPAPPATWLAAAACGLLAANILLVNNIRDIATDKLAGKRTLAVRFGRKFAHRFYRFNIFCALATPVVFFAIHYGPYVLVALVEIPLGLLLLKVLTATPDGDGPRFNRLLAHSAQFLALWSALLSLGIILS